jgi:thioredoxin reductase (NADPH)
VEDLIIIGGGPAGMTAGLYAGRSRLKTVLFERLAPGGQILTTDWVENYPGFPDGVSGFELVERMRSHAEKFGLVIQNQEVLRLEFAPDKKIVITEKGDRECKALILACGASFRKLGIEGEEILTGKGVSYCATCDGAFYRDQEVAVIGGGDTAVEEALFLTRFASRVHLIHRREELRAAKLIQERALNEKKIAVLWYTVATKILGESGVEGVELKNVKTGEVSRLPVNGVFVFVGFVPNNQLVDGLMDLDEAGFVVTDDRMETSVPGVFAAGDLRSKPLRQISTAVGEGATAAFVAEKFMNGLH